MAAIAWLLVGLLLGGCVVTTILCCLQINRINGYEQIIQILQDKTNEK